MTIEPQWLFLGGVAALAGSFALLVRARERKRRAAYEEFCMIRGFTFEPERPDGERRFAAAFEPFNEGRRRTWAYTISGTKNQAPFTVFEIRRFFEATPQQQVAGGGRFLFWFRNTQLPAAAALDEWLEQGDQVRRRFLTS